MTPASIRLPALFALLAILLCAQSAYSMGRVLGETKEQLKLQYELKVTDHGTGRVTAVLTLSDAGEGPGARVTLHFPNVRGAEGPAARELIEETHGG